MRSILEKALVHLLNEENEQAEALFHKYMVAQAKQIHESLRSGDDALLESFDDINSDEMFTEHDLTGLEDGDDTFGGDAMAPAAEDEAAADMTGAAADLGDAKGDLDDAEADLSGDLGAESAEGDETADRLDDLADRLEKLTAAFEAEVGPLDDVADPVGDEPTMGGEDETFGGEVEGDLADEGAEKADDVADDMTDEPSKDEDGVSESEENEEGDVEDEPNAYTDLDESIISDLEKVLVSMTDGKEIGAGKSFEQNTKSAALQGKPDPMKGGKPWASKGGEHKGFERETAPATKDMKKRQNTKAKAEDGRAKVSKEGDKAATINKDFAGTSTNDKSTLISR